MTGSAYSWLPATAFTPSAVNAVLENALVGWAGRWFVGTVAVGAVYAGLTGPRLPQVTQIDAAGRGATAIALGRTKRVLLEKMLGLSLQGCTLNQHDHQLLDSLGKMALTNLVEQIDGWLETYGPDASGSEQLTLTLSVEGGEILQLDLPRSALAATLRANATALGSPQKLNRRADALGDTAVSVDALLGVSSVSFADFAHLTVGDVLLLEGTTEDPARLRLAMTGSPLAPAELGRDDDRVTLTLN